VYIVVIIATSECGVVMRLVASVCLCVCLSVRAPSFEGLHLETSHLVCRYPTLS